MVKLCLNFTATVIYITIDTLKVDAVAHEGAHIRNNIMPTIIYNLEDDYYGFDLVPYSIQQVPRAIVFQNTIDVSYARGQRV